MTRPPRTIGVAGAGTMGAGIAQLACAAGARTLLYDPDADALARGRDRVHAGLAHAVERQRLTAQDAYAARERLEPTATVDALATAELVIEAAPESLEVKQALFAELSATVTNPDAVLATNTSSLLVTAIASAARHPERVVGMHFFNPAPVMRLLEVVAGELTAEPALALARATGEAMGKEVIVARDGPGFLVNRCSRPFGLEALKLAQEGAASPEEIDRICRLGGGFRMGPFELMDLVGIDVGFDVARSFYEQSFGEPRWRPSPITARLVAAGRLGRKAGHGFYDYAQRPYRPEDPPPPRVPPPPLEPLNPKTATPRGLVVIAGATTLADELASAAGVAGWDVRTAGEARGDVPVLILDCTLGEEPEAPLQGGPQAICCAAGSLAALDPEGTAAGFHLLPPVATSQLVELTRGPDTADSAAAATTAFFTSLGKHVAWVGDAPGLVLGRIVCQLVNEAAFALGEGVGTAHDIDLGVTAGLNYPRGILHWADSIGLDHVLAVLDALTAERGEERYRVAPALRRLAWSGRLGRETGAGFFAY